MEKPVEGRRLFGRQIPQIRLRPDRERRSSDQREARCTTLPRKASNEGKCARTKTDTGRRGENPKVRGKTLVKELGKMHP